jgi:hypothetical protein
MKQLENVKTGRVRKSAKIRRSLKTAGTTLQTATKGQSVLKDSTLTRKQNVVKISVQQAVKIQLTFHNAESVNKKVRYWTMIVIPTPYAQEARKSDRTAEQISTLTRNLVPANWDHVNLLLLLLIARTKPILKIVTTS